MYRVTAILLQQCVSRKSNAAKIGIVDMKDMNSRRQVMDARQ